MVNKVMIRKSINDLLSQMLEKKLIAKQKEIDGILAKGLSGTNLKLERALQSLTEMEDSYQYDKWLSYAAYNMTKSATLATHISKGVHSMSRGDSVLFTDKGDRPNYIAGSHNIKTDLLDISGSAASLPIYNFINLEIDDTTIKQLIEQSDPAMIAALSDDEETALELLRAFQDFLGKQVEQPLTSDLNKQLLFPKNADSFEIDAVDELEYEAIVPLYASVLLHEVRNKINHINYSDEHKEAIKNRFASDADELEHAPYKTVKNLATIKLGGSKPANISKVVVMSAGEMILLPNNPPPMNKISAYWIPKYIHSIFDSTKIEAMLSKNINRLARASIAYDKRAIYKTKNDKRAALELVIKDVFDIALTLQKNKAGWLIDHALFEHEQYWLDPMRGTLAGMEDYEQARQRSHWRAKTVLMIANRINNSLEAVGGEHAAIFNADNFNDIRKAVDAMAKQFKHNKSEVFHDR